MIIGIIAGIGIGLALATVFFARLIFSSKRRADMNADTVEELLIRKAEACERIADALENFHQS